MIIILVEACKKSENVVGKHKQWSQHKAVSQQEEITEGVTHTVVAT